MLEIKIYLDIGLIYFSIDEIPSYLFVKSFMEIGKLKIFRFLLVLVFVFIAVVVLINFLFRTRFSEFSLDVAKQRLSVHYDLPESYFRDTHVGLYLGFMRSGPELQRFSLSGENIPKMLSSLNFSQVRGNRFHRDYNIDWWTELSETVDQNFKSYISESGNITLWVNFTSGDCLAVNTGGM